MYRKIFISISALLSILVICFSTQGCGPGTDQGDWEADRFEVDLTLDAKRTLTPTASVTVRGRDGKVLVPENVVQICVTMRGLRNGTNHTIKIGEKQLQAQKTLSLTEGEQYYISAYATYKENWLDPQDGKYKPRIKTNYTKEIGGVGIFDYDPGNPFE